MASLSVAGVALLPVAEVALYQLPHNSCFTLGPRLTPPEHQVVQKLGLDDERRPVSVLRLIDVCTRPSESACKQLKFVNLGSIKILHIYFNITNKDRSV